MLVIYRITDIPSTNPSPIFQTDKVALNKLCLKSFINAFSDLKPKVVFLADHVSDYSYLEEFPWEYEIIKTKDGQNQAMINSYEIASKVDDYVLFHECDYLYKDVCGKTFLRALRELKLVSPYDHLNFYKDPNLHSENCKIKLVDNHHFRSTERNTMTWGCHSNIVKENLDMLNGHGYLDGQVWYDLKDKGYELYVPIPSMATHMVRDWLAPGVNWEELWQSLV